MLLATVEAGVVVSPLSLLRECTLDLLRGRSQLHLAIDALRLTSLSQSHDRWFQYLFHLYLGELAVSTVSRVVSCFRVLDVRHEFNCFSVLRLVFNKIILELVFQLWLYLFGVLFVKCLLPKSLLIANDKILLI